MSVILQISDPHFGTEVPAVLQALEALSQSLAPDLLVLSGDITQRARSRQFGAAAAFVRRLNVAHQLAIPGNHDLPLFDIARRLFDPYGQYRRAFGNNLEPTFECSDCLVLGVNTTRRYRHTDGEISPRQCERVATALHNASPTQLRIIVLHQPVAVPRATEAHNIVHGGDAAVRTWANAGADLILGGHIHLPFVLPLHEVLGPLTHPLWAVNAGTAVSRRTRYDAGNSVNVLRTSREQPRACELEQWTYFEPTTSFALSATLRLG
jgi:3',5'-cyclic AMP phosphodiesterase CpdA